MASPWDPEGRKRSCCMVNHGADTLIIPTGKLLTPWEQTSPGTAKMPPPHPGDAVASEPLWGEKSREDTRMSKTIQQLFTGCAPLAYGGLLVPLWPLGVSWWPSRRGQYVLCVGSVRRVGDAGPVGRGRAQQQWALRARGRARGGALQVPTWTAKAGSGQGTQTLQHHPRPALLLT